MDITQDFQKLFNQIDRAGELAIEATKEVVDEYATRFYEGLKADTPVKTGGLKESLEITKDNRIGWHGYNVEYVGNAPNGEPYQKIANILNYGAAAEEGRGGIAGQHFLQKNIRKLKGMDARIEARFESKINKET